MSPEFIQIISEIAKRDTQTRFQGRTPQTKKELLKIDLHCSTSPQSVRAPRRAHTLGNKPKKRQARVRWRQVNIAGQGGS
ncbi:hypothetical protein TNCV_1887351 [Trichonephila clavipes]|nr:hypothetical protein TNCV_1887351 [Trichonephila clavipes]